MKKEKSWKFVKTFGVGAPRKNGGTKIIIFFFILYNKIKGFMMNDKLVSIQAGFCSINTFDKENNVSKNKLVNIYENSILVSVSYCKEVN